MDQIKVRDTAEAGYADYLQTVRSYAQAPYRWNLRRLKLGRALDIGCGIGRNLAVLDGVGIDHNAACVAVARSRGLEAYTPSDFHSEPESFDSLLFAHVLEHMSANEARELVRQYLPYLVPGGRAVFITPQELGYLSDASHVEFMDFAALRDVTASVGLKVERSYSFPLPRWGGRLFKFNEFVVICRRRKS